MQKNPASLQKFENVQTYEFDSRGWHSFPETSTSLFPSIKLIDCEVENELDPEDVEFEFFQKGGEVFGKHSKLVIDAVDLETNEFGSVMPDFYEGRPNLTHWLTEVRKRPSFVPTYQETIT